MRGEFSEVRIAEINESRNARAETPEMESSRESFVININE
jgi:hypothetical protein